MSAIKDDLLTSIVAVSTEAGNKMTKVEAERALSAVLQGIINTVKEKESIRTAIGTFKWVNVEARDRINPRTGEKVHVPAYSTLKFKTSSAVRVSADAAQPAAKTTAKAAVKVAAKPAVKAATPARKVIAKKK
jgi:DNA-binding protein HU-beta